MFQGRLTRIYFAFLAAIPCSLPANSGLFGDIDGSSQVDAVDVQLVINSALGEAVAFPADVDSSGATDAVDVQLVINTALGVTTTPPGTVTGLYDPGTGLQLATGGISIDIPAGAVAGPVTISMKKFAPADAPVSVPGGVNLVGAVFGPDGQLFSSPASVSLALPGATVARSLPVLTFDTVLNSWVGTGEIAAVNPNGLDVTFPVNHFSIAGVPDAVPIPDPGGPVGSFVVLSNNGNLSTDAISSTEAALIYSAFGTTFSISATSQELNNEGHIETKAIGLSAIQVYSVENYIVGVVGGTTSLFNAGTTNEPAVGVMIMSVTGNAVSLSLYVATPERVIQGTLSGTM
ncbi:MAG: hypothetical protein HZB26_26615 [Candidatus Hydrogenedentes bacterium]|nr:hypothetical protein [Candidatus Hydrogenedentota bacterium]